MTLAGSALREHCPTLRFPCPCTRGLYEGIPAPKAPKEESLMSNSARLTAALFTCCTAFACTQGGAKNSETAAPVKATSQPASKPASQAAVDGAKGGLSSADRDAVDPDGVVRRGAVLSEAQILTVAQAYAQGDALKGKSVKVKGEVSQVCQKSGCWFILREGGQNIRITSKGYKYFVPASAPGMTAVVEGELDVKTLDVKTAQHYADDAAEATGEAPVKVEAPVKEISIASIGLEMRK